MRSVLRSDDFEEKLRIQEYPDNFCNGEIVERSMQSCFNGIEKEIHEITFNGVCINYLNIFSPKPISIDVEHDFPFLKMQFELCGHSHYQPKTSHHGQIVEIRNGTHQLFYIPRVKGALTYPRTGHRSSLSIKFTIPYLKSIFGDDLSPLQAFWNNIEAQKPSFLHESSMPITPLQKCVITDLLNCSFKGQLKKIYLETKVRELLLLQIDQMRTLSKVNDTPTLSKEDIDKIHFAKELLNNNLRKTYSINELSKLAGLNSYKLKLGFKAIFQTTVFGYQTDLRMSEAQNMLKQNKYSIADISYLVGYKNPQHFTVAFKKKYGIKPSELKRCAF